MAANLRVALVNEFQPSTLARSVASGSLLFVVEIGFAASFGALVYAQAAPDRLSEGIGLLIVGNAILIAVIALFSTYRGSIGTVQDLPAAVLGLAAVNVAGVGGVAFPTIVLMVLLTTVLAGVAFILLGAFKLGNLVRFLPYPVMGGFLAGTGYLLVTGGVGIVTSNRGLDLLTPNTAIRLLPALALGVAMFLARRRLTNPLWLPGLVLIGVALFFGTAAVLGQSVVELTAGGWLVGGLPEAELWQFPLSSELISQADWSAIWDQIPVLLPMILISAIALLLNTNGLELIIKRDLDLNRELVVTGVANVLSAFGGGLVGYSAISTTSLNHSMMPNRRLPGLIVAGLFLVTVVFGAPLVALMPKLVLGGIVIFVGLMLLAEWVYDAWFSFSRVDFLIILLILITIAWQGFLVGVIVGILAALVMFVVSYSRTTIIRDALSGADYRSRVTRSPASVAALAQLCLQIYILRLQGFIFFGTANTLLETVRRHTQNALTRYVLLDFTHVSGLDSTALLSFEKMRQLAAKEGITLVLAGMTPALHNQIIRGGFTEDGRTVYFASTADAGVAWCEDQLLASLDAPPSEPDTLAAQLEYLLPGGATEHLIPYLTPLTTATGDYLMRQGDRPDYMFFIESGQVTAQLERDDAPATRLETMQGGHVVGELGFYLNTPRTAAVVVDQPGVVYRLSRSDFTRLQVEDPAAFNALQQIMIHLLSERLVKLTRAFQAVQG
jgi:SulP family sulfate permease